MPWRPRPFDAALCPQSTNRNTSAASALMTGSFNACSSCRTFSAYIPRPAAGGGGRSRGSFAQSRLEQLLLLLEIRKPVAQGAAVVTFFDRADDLRDPLKGTEEAPSPRRGFFSFDGNSGVQKKSPAVGRASPVQAYDFPSRTRESRCAHASLASVAILRQPKGYAEISLRRYRKVTGMLRWA